MVQTLEKRLVLYYYSRIKPINLASALKANEHPFMTNNFIKDAYLAMIALIVLKYQIMIWEKPTEVVRRKCMKKICLPGGVFGRLTSLLGIM